MGEPRLRETAHYDINEAVEVKYVHGLEGRRKNVVNEMNLTKDEATRARLKKGFQIYLASLDAMIAAEVGKKG